MLWLSAIVHAEIDVSLYSGLSHTQASDVSLSQPDNTQLTFHAVNWDDKSLENPVYWGLRVVYWLPHEPAWGLALDFTHAKIHADLGQYVTVTGTRQASPVNAQEPLASNFDDLAMSHGLNFLTFNGMYRWQDWKRLRPLVGFGGGIVYPHVEVKIGNSHTDEYQVAGWTVNGMVGLNYALTQSVAIFAGYKLSYADVRAELSGGGQLQTAIWTHHLNLGMTYTFGRGD